MSNDKPNYVADVLRDAEPGKVLERRREALEKFYTGEEMAQTPPIATGPTGEDAGAYEVPQKKAGPARSTRRTPPVLLVVGLAAAVTMPALVGVVLATRNTEKKIAEAMARAATSTTARTGPSAGAGSSAPARATAAEPAATAMATATATASVTATASAAASVERAVPPTPAPKKHPKAAPRHDGDDRHEGGPAVPQPTEPAPPPPPPKPEAID